VGVVGALAKGKGKGLGGLGKGGKGPAAPDASAAKSAGSPDGDMAGHAHGGAKREFFA